MQVTNHAFTRSDHDRWSELATAELAVLVDLDGTLIELAPTPEQAILAEDAVRTLSHLARIGVHLAVVSGRPRASIAPLVARVPQIWWFAEHGAWCYRDGAWSGPVETADELVMLASVVEAIASVPGARIERKSLAICIHWREVEPSNRPAFVAAIEIACGEWLEAHPDFERLPGIEHLEIRRRGIDKGSAVRLVRAHARDARIIAIGDDTTDEDMFQELGTGDVAIAVGRRPTRTRVDGVLGGPVDVRAFLHWLVDCRTGSNPGVVPVLTRRSLRQRSLVVISSRATLARERREVGALVSALEPGLRDRTATWLGWNGKAREGRSRLVLDPQANPARASFELPHEWQSLHSSFCDRGLWALLNGFPMGVTYHDEEWRAYQGANDVYAEHASELATRDAPIWVLDYQLLLAASSLRRLGHEGPIGLFLHSPFPSPQAFETFPWRHELIDGLLAFDLIGFHTDLWAANFLETVRRTGLADVTSDRLCTGERTTRVGVFPIGVDHPRLATVTAESSEIARLRQSLGARRLLLGIDRLDEAKGIPQRLAGFERLLELHPEWRGEVSLVQASLPSRYEVPDQPQLKARVEAIVGRINGRFGEADWVPVRYVSRAYPPEVLAQLYRLAEVALVTPLCDGMNLVAKEFVAAQDPDRPGVLVLSRFAGAARELCDAVLTNPLHPDGLAADIDRALRMPLEERRRRHALLDAAVRRSSPAAWVASFLDELVPEVAPSVQRSIHLAPAVVGDPAMN